MSSISIIADIGADALLTRLEKHWQSYENKMFEVEIAGEPFVVLPAVYNPDAPVTRAMSNAVEVPAGSRVLDLGCGTGVLGVLALKRGAGHVVFADLNPAAVANATANVEKHGFGDRATVVETDLFANVGSTKFDVIIFNAPFLYAATEVSRMTMGTDSGLFRPGVPPPESFFDEGYKLLARFYSQVREHLAPAGFIQFSFSNLGNGEALNKILDANRFKRDHVLTETTGTFEWQVFHVRPID